jgi:hypothetical protein
VSAGNFLIFSQKTVLADAKATYRLLVYCAGLFGLNKNFGATD